MHGGHQVTRRPDVYFGAFTPFTRGVTFPAYSLLMEKPPQLDGADKIAAWWGEWIDFHDFYLLKVPPAGSVDGELRIHGWITDSENLDSQGHFTVSKDCVVTIVMEGIRSMKLSSKETPAIIFELGIRRAPSGWTVAWDSSYGAEGTIEAKDVRIDLEPGPPETRKRLGNTPL
jgi:hypothetical protein